MAYHIYNKLKSLTKDECYEQEDAYKAKLEMAEVPMKGKMSAFRDTLRKLDGKPKDEIIKELENLAEIFILRDSPRISKAVGVQAVKPEEFTDEELLEASRILDQGTDKVIKHMEEVSRAIHAGDAILRSFLYIADLSCLVEEYKNHIWVIGGSGKGKSHVLYAVLNLFPEDTYEIFTSASPLFLHYFVSTYGEDVFKDKILLIDEAEASKDTLPMLRSITGQTPIEPRHGTIKEQRLLDIKMKNRPTVNFTSVHAYGTEQIKNRLLFINPDESEKQDLAVFELQQALRGKAKIIDKKTEKSLKICRAITRIIIEKTKDLDVLVPWSIKNWPYTDKRFLFPMFLTFVKSITRIGFKQRRQGDILITEKADMLAAARLWSIFHKTIRYRVSSSAWEIYKVLEEEGIDQQAAAEMWQTTHAWIGDKINLSSKQAQRLCEKLLEENLVSRVKSAKSSGQGPKPWVYWKKKIVDPKEMEFEHDASVRP